VNAFQYYQPTEILFGAGRVDEVGDAVARHGRRCLLVSRPVAGAFGPSVARIKTLLEAAGIDVAHYDGVIPNPTVECITAGADMAVEHGSDVVLGVGGGSAMDAAKAIAVEATHEGTAWDYLFYRDTQPTDATLPVVAVSSTSGSASHVTQVAVVTNSATRDKSAIYHDKVFPRLGIVDPQLMVTAPRHITAATGFDVFCHAFESLLHPGASPYTEMLAWEAIRLVVDSLPRALDDGSDLEARASMAWADTLAGLCIANAGVTLPHGIAMAIGGMYPHVAHGVALASCYPAFSRFTWPSAVDRFAGAGRIFDPGLAGARDEEAAERCCGAIDAFLQRVGLWTGLEALEVPESELADLARQSMVLPDYENNPRVATLDEMQGVLTASYRQ
jgi:alcohol dehydrogenase class IV